MVNKMNTSDCLPHIPIIDDKAEAIYEMLSTQKFYNWYCDGGRFDDFIQGGIEYVLSKDEILDDIRKIFRL